MGSSFSMPFLQLHKTFKLESSSRERSGAGTGPKSLKPQAQVQVIQVITPFQLACAKMPSSALHTGK